METLIMIYVFVQSKPIDFKTLEESSLDRL
jgi:hypothetical protein